MRKMAEIRLAMQHGLAIHEDGIVALEETLPLQVDGGVIRPLANVADLRGFYSISNQLKSVVTHHQGCSYYCSNSK